MLVDNAVDAHTPSVNNPRLLLCSYRQYVKGKSPVYVIDISVPREEVDINVTPDKVSHETLFLWVPLSGAVAPRSVVENASVP